MGKIDYRRLSKKSYVFLGREFRKTCTSATSVAQLTRFIDGLLLPSERVMFARRIQAARKLLKEDPQTKIMSELNIGQATVDPPSSRTWCASALVRDYGRVPHSSFRDSLRCYNL
ncbi:hypothetical protein KJ996_04650 [Patescibacteria group bacterium]|nr:hypothetical protein [Patescibacteria group bacterium]